MRRSVAGEAVIMHFPVLDLDGFTPLTGVLDGQWVKTIAKDGVAQTGFPMTVAELGATGIYVATITPDAPGQWYAEAYEPTTQQLYACEIDASGDATAHCLVSYDHVPDLRVWIQAWLERNGRHVVDPSSCTVTLYDKDGLLIFTKTAPSPDAQGSFLIEQSTTSGGGVDLGANLPWTVKVEITDARGVTRTTQGFAT